MRRCDCESLTCKENHAIAGCRNEGTVKTHWSTICAACAQYMPSEYLVKLDRGRLQAKYEKIIREKLVEIRDAAMELEAIVEFAAMGDGELLGENSLWLWASNVVRGAERIKCNTLGELELPNQ